MTWFGLRNEKALLLSDGRAIRKEMRSRRYHQSALLEEMTSLGGKWARPCHWKQILSPKLLRLLAILESPLFLDFLQQCKTPNISQDCRPCFFGDKRNGFERSVDVWISWFRRVLAAGHKEQRRTNDESRNPRCLSKAGVSLIQVVPSFVLMLDLWCYCNLPFYDKTMSLQRCFA